MILFQSLFELKINKKDVHDYLALETKVYNLLNLILCLLFLLKFYTKQHRLKVEI